MSKELSAEAQEGSVHRKLPDAEQASRVLGWELTIADSEFTLVGSVHVGTSKLYPLDERLESRFARSRALVLELDTSSIDPGSVAEKMRQLGQFAPGQSLEQVVSVDTFTQLTEVLAKQGRSPEIFMQFRPWFVATALTNESLRAAGFEARFGIDEHFRSLAEARRMPVVPLETLGEQLSLLAGLTRQTAESLLKSALSEMDEHGQQLSTLLQLWQRGDASGLDELMLQPLREQHTQLFEHIFVHRNRKMVESLMAVANQPGRYFVVVGAGHLIGSLGMVDLFARQGIVAHQL